MFLDKYGNPNPFTPQRQAPDGCVTATWKHEHLRYLSNDKGVGSFLHQDIWRNWRYFLQSPETNYRSPSLGKEFFRTALVRPLIEALYEIHSTALQVWNERRVVVEKHEVVTMEYMPDFARRKLMEHKGMTQQIEEWRSMGYAVDDNPNEEDILHLSLDTKFFADMPAGSLDFVKPPPHYRQSTLIKGDNIHALRVLQQDRRGAFKCIFIDPPFNLNKKGAYRYSVNYDDDTWATMMRDRLEIAHELLHETGSIFVRCDYRGNFIMRSLLDDIFGKANFRNEIAIRKTNRIKTKGTRYLSWHETLFYYAKDKSKVLFHHQTTPQQVRSYRSMDKPGDTWEVIPQERIHLYSEKNIRLNEEGLPTTRARIILGREFLPALGRRYSNQSRINELEREGQLRINKNGTPQMIKPPHVPLTDDWTDVASYSNYTNSHDFTTENAEALLERVIKTSTTEGNLVLDFFMGSATTLAVAYKLKRSFVGVDSGAFFHDISVKRLKKVMSEEKKRKGMSFSRVPPTEGFLQYVSLESFEDALNNYCKEKLTS